MGTVPIVREFQKAESPAEPQDPPAEPQEPDDWMATKVSLTFQINPETQNAVSANVLLPTSVYAAALPEDSGPE